MLPLPFFMVLIVPKVQVVHPGMRFFLAVWRLRVFA